MSTILVTGGCGYIGSHVTRQLSEAGRKVVVVDDLSTGFRETLLHGEELVVASLADEAALAQLFKQHRFDLVMHFAASISVPESVANPLAYYDNNTVNTLKLLRACVAAGVPRFVFSSTAAVYGEHTETEMRETTATLPANPYGASKLMDERIIADVAKAHGMSYVILRYFNVAGADPEGRIGQRARNATHLIKVACEAVLGKRPEMQVFGTDYPTRDGTCIRDYIHVEDLAAAHLAALRYLEKGGASDVFNCGYGRGASVLEVLRALEDVSGRKVPHRVAPRRAGDVSALVANSDKLRAATDWRPRLDDLRAIVKSAYEWERRLP